MKIKFSANLKTTTAIAIILMFSMLISTLSVQSVNAQTTYTNLQDGSSMPLPTGVTADETVTTSAHLSYRPNPVGLNQPILVNLWMQPPIHVTHYFKNAFMVTFTKPDGTTEQVGPLSSYQGDSTAWFEKKMDQMGTWTIKFDFLGAYFPAGNYTIVAGTFSGQGGVSTNAVFPNSIYYAPSSDGPYNITVQQDLIASWPTAPLPTDYWTRPIEPQNREWWPIAGNYPATGILGGGTDWPADTNTYMSNYGFIPYVQAPNTAHIVWKRQGATAGLIGGEAGQYSITTGPGTPSLVYAGRAYQTLTKILNGVQTSVWECYDLRTGEVYWDQTGVTQVPTFIGYDPQALSTTIAGAEASSSWVASLVFVGSGRLIKYNPWIGSATLNISIAPLTTATPYAYPNFLSIQNIGSTASPNYRLITWTVATGGLSTTPIVQFTSNVSYPFASIGTADYESMIAVTTQGIRDIPASGQVASWEPTAAVNSGVSYSYRIIGVSLSTGQVQFNVTTNQAYGGVFSGSTAVADHGKFALRMNDGHWHAWDLHTGNELWTSEMSSWPWGSFGIYGVTSYGGLIIYPQYDGVVAYNWTNGKVAWRYQYETPYPYETPYEGNYPFYSSAVDIADGKLYTSNTEHTPSNPITRGWKLHCMNVTTGEGIWNITGSFSAGAVADGYLTASDGYDGYMYVFGKGLSSTTVSAPQNQIIAGQNAVISGTVLDQSPAQTGKACVSDSSMATWMEYLHMQMPIDGLSHKVIITGVPVSIDAVDPNGNTIHLATVTSDVSGTFAYTWTPSLAGDWRITATFAGSGSYGSSYAEAHANVVNAPTTTVTPTTISSASVTSTDVMTYIVIAAIAIIIAVAIVGALIIRTIARKHS